MLLLPLLFGVLADKGPLAYRYPAAQSEACYSNLPKRSKCFSGKWQRNCKASQSANVFEKASQSGRPTGLYLCPAAPVFPGG